MKNEEEILKEIEKQVSRIAAEANARSVPELDNLSPNDMRQIIYHTFGEESSVGFKASIAQSALKQIPFLNLFNAYLKEIIKVNELKLTAIGNLPTKLCFYLYGLGFLKEEAIESGFKKLNKEGDSLTLPNIKIMGILSGITKKRNNKISLTKKGQRLIENDDLGGILKEIFIVNCTQFNLGYHDGYTQQAKIQRTFGYTLYLLLRYGQQKRSLNFYIYKNLVAFPFLLDDFEEKWRSKEHQFDDCYTLRIFERFLKYYGFVELKIKRDYVNRPKSEVKTSTIFNEIFELRKDKFQFSKSEFKA